MEWGSGLGEVAPGTKATGSPTWSSRPSRPPLHYLFPSSPPLQKGLIPMAGHIIEAVFTFERDTKNKYRFTEEVPTDTEDTLGTIYIRKSKFPDGHPTKLRVTIAPED